MVAKQDEDLSNCKKTTANRNTIMDSIVALVAKENMPLRIVESPYFAQLLLESQLLLAQLLLVIFYYGVFFIIDLFFLLWLTLQNLAARHENIVPISQKLTSGADDVEPPNENDSNVNASTNTISQEFLQPICSRRTVRRQILVSRKNKLFFFYFARKLRFFITVFHRVNYFF